MPKLNNITPPNYSFVYSEFNLTNKFYHYSCVIMVEFILLLNYVKKAYFITNLMYKQSNIQ